jgi:SAM-dependent methyltransferase
MAEFDRYKDTYEPQLDEVIRFSGQDRAFFTRAKARWLLDIARRRVGEPGALSALDVGCGVGLTVSEVVGAFGEVSGVDISSAMIERASERNPEVDYRVYDGTRLPHDDASFDVAFTICVLHHVPSTSRSGLVDEIRRVLRPGGLALIGEHNPWNPLTRFTVSRCAFDEDAHLLRASESARLLRAAGLDVVERRYILVTPFESVPAQRVERALGGVALGAQYLVAAMRTDAG